MRAIEEMQKWVDGKEMGRNVEPITVEVVKKWIKKLSEEDRETHETVCIECGEICDE